MTDKKADLAGPGVGNYDDLEKILPDDYEPLLPPKERMKAVFSLKNYIEENLCKKEGSNLVAFPSIMFIVILMGHFLVISGPSAILLWRI